MSLLGFLEYFFYIPSIMLLSENEVWNSWGNDFPCRQQNQTKPYQTKSPIFSEKYWYYFRCPKNVLCSILSFVFWIFPPLDTAVQLESADSKQNTISKSLFHYSFSTFFGQWVKCIILSEKKRPLDWTRPDQTGPDRTRPNKTKSIKCFINYLWW